MSFTILFIALNFIHVCVGWWGSGHLIIAQLAHEELKSNPADKNVSEEQTISFKSVLYSLFLLLLLCVLNEVHIVFCVVQLVDSLDALLNDTSVFFPNLSGFVDVATWADNLHDEFGTEMFGKWHFAVITKNVFCFDYFTFFNLQNTNSIFFFKFRIVHCFYFQLQQ